MQILIFPINYKCSEIITDTTRMLKENRDSDEKTFLNLINTPFRIQERRNLVRQYKVLDGIMSYWYTTKILKKHGRPMVV